MITRLKISRFKGLRSAEIELGGNVVFIGPNNSGKSTALQALTLWDVGWRRWAERWEKKDADGNFVKRPKVKSGVTINRRDLHAIPVPTAKLLWHELHTHDTTPGTGKDRKTTAVLIQVEVEGVSSTGVWTCGIEFYYANEESFYCRLMGGPDQHLPAEVYNHPVVFLPPMSGLADREFRKESGEIRMLTGQGQTAQVLRNLCWQLYSAGDKTAWERLVGRIEKHFSVTLLPPVYDPVNSSLALAYKDQNGTELDISSSGRGCQQVTLLLCFLLQHPGAILLLDEPDAHLEILRQRDIYTLLTETAASQHSQIIAASHSSTVMQVAGERDVLVAFLGSPHRVDTRARQNQVKKALESIPLSDFYLAQQAGWMLYLEGTTDLDILRKLSARKNHPAASILAGRVPLICLGSNKPGDARSHFEAMREAMPGIPALAIFDRLPNPETQLSTMPGLLEKMWTRREIENYLVTPVSLLAYASAGMETDDLFSRAERERRGTVMAECIAELEQALSVTRKPSPWSPEIKVTDDFLDPLFVNYYQRLGTPQLTYKRDYHGLADVMPLDELDPEIDRMLDAVAATAGAAVPAQ